MPDELSDLAIAIAGVEDADDDFLDPRRLSQLLDRVVAKHSRVLHRARVRGDWKASGLTAINWTARVCGISRRTAADRLCVGKHLESLPLAAGELRQGEIGFQAVSSMSHLQENLGERWPDGLEADLVGYARKFTAERFRFTCRHAHHVIDPDDFDKLAEQDFERRWLEINTLLDGMYSVDGVLDSATGSAFKAALESLATPRGPEDTRTRGQRTADALGELLHHEMSIGRLPRKKGVRPHITLTTSLAGLKSEAGTPAAELESGVPISRKTVERMACDSTVSRVLLADSVVVDVGRATRTVQPATRRRAEQAGRRLPLSWMRTARWVVVGASHRVLGSRRKDRALQPDPAVSLPPPPGPRRGMAGDQGGREGPVHSAGALAGIVRAGTGCGLGCLKIEKGRRVPPLWGKR